MTDNTPNLLEMVEFPTVVLEMLLVPRLLVDRVVSSLLGCILDHNTMPSYRRESPEGGLLTNLDWLVFAQGSVSNGFFERKRNTFF